MNELEHASLCFLSKESQHDSTIVYQIQKMTVEYLKCKIANLQCFEYFSDGCGAQNNKKSFNNLCNHYDDFGVHASWSLFATSHGKSPCGGIGGTVKRSTAMGS